MNNGAQTARAALDALGIKMREETDTIIQGQKQRALHVNSTAAAVYEIWNSIGKICSDPAYHHNKEQVTELHSNGSSKTEFTGANTSTIKAAFKGDLDTAPFRAAQDKVKGLVNIATLDALASKRRTRYLSEHDGEFDFDRRYDLNPFNATRIENNGALRVIDIDVEFSFNCSVGASKIAAYGALAWSIVDLIERAGIQVNLNLVQLLDQSQETKIDKTVEFSTPNYIVNTIQLKRAGEYVDTMQLARCFTPYFFRRCSFALFTAEAQARGRDTFYNLGYPKNNPSSATLGRLYIGSENVNGREHNLQQLAGFIKTALGLETQTD